MAPPPPPASMNPVTVAPDLVGRTCELARLREALEGAVAGSGSLHFVVGEAGIGKSRLVRAVAAEASARSVPVLWGRAVPGPVPSPYRPLAEALSAAVRTGSAPDAAALGPLRTVLGRLVPGWSEGDRVPLEPSLVAMAEGVLRFVTAVPDGPGALLVLEDLHWADPETLTIVEYLADHAASAPVLCVATLRNEARSAGMEVARSLRARRVSPVHELAPLDGPEVAALVASCLGTPAAPGAVVALAARAEGVPLMVEELLAAAVSSGALLLDDGTWQPAPDLHSVVPPTFAESLRHRLDQLGEQVRTVVVAAAVLGRQFPWDLLPVMTGLGADEVTAALRTAVDAQIVTVGPAGPSFRFRHALSRDAVLQGLLPPELEAHARRALAAVAAAHPELDQGWGELAATLAAWAGDRARAGALLLEAGRRALDRGALASAEAALLRARSFLDERDPARTEVDDQLVHILSLAGKRDEAQAVAASLLRRLGRDREAARRRAEIHLRLARAAVAATRWEEAHQHLERAAGEVGPGAGGELSARLGAVRAQVAIVRQPDRAPALAAAALATAEHLGLADVACEALEVLGRVERRRNLPAAEGAFTRALALAESHGLTVWRARALQELGAIDMLRGRPLVRLEEARELALAHGALATVAVVDVQMAAALAVADDPEAGAVVARRSADLSRRYHLDQTLAAALALEAYAHARQRRKTELQRCIGEARALAPGVPDIEIKASSAAALAALVEEDRASARRHLCAGLAVAARAGTDYSVAPAIGLLALLRQLDGAVDEAPEVLIPEDSVHFVASAYLGYASAVAVGRAGRPDAAALVAGADTHLADHHWFRHLGRRLVAEAAVADGWADPVAWLREALDFFDGRGDDRLASACRSLLRRAGATVPRRRAASAVPGALRALGVTDRELEVLQLLAGGLANREIAARLYLSPRTVERHLANLGVKTGAARRSELVAYAARTLGAPPGP